DRDAGTPGEHVVEIRVARIAVVDGVPGETAFAEQCARDVGGGGARHVAGEAVQLGERNRKVEIGVRVLGDEQCGLVERDLVRWPPHELREALGRVHIPPYTAPMPASKRAAPAEGLHDTVSTRLRGVNQRVTANRRAIVEALSDASRPMTIPELLESPGGRGLAQSSVYRNLVVLEQAGLVHRIVTDGEFARFELAEDLTEH